MSVEMDRPDSEVVGIPGLVQQMIGRFSCKELDGVISGYSISTKSTMKNGPTASKQERSLALSDSASQGNSPTQITRFQPWCEETGQKKSLHVKSSDLCFKLPSRTKVNQCNLEVKNTAIVESTVITGDSDSNKNLSRTVSAGVTVDSSKKKAPPLHPKSYKVQNLFKRQPKNSDSALNGFRSQKNGLDHSETEEVNNCPSDGVQNCIRGSAELSGSKINQNNEFSNGQSHAVQSVSDSNDCLTETKKCNINGGQDDSQETNNMHQESTEKDGHYFLNLMSIVECELTKHCKQLELLLSEQITEEASGRIRAAIGKANLLMTKKFKQFRELCHKNLVNSTDEPFQTTSEDLNGFWDLVQLQVDDVQRLFAEIQRLHDNNWIDDDPEKTPQLAKIMEVKPRDQRVKSLTRKVNPSETSDKFKARKEARRRLLATKIAGRQRKASEIEEDIQIFIC